ncbi:hypothetical protein MTR_6g065450 [Medicago truncatula]|uniref:Uncharacterized protein n=1 Tax=Medicago truncatula TaxID=3880 RepID=G7KP85_MEDTR|nr:hypothetical protein MTR_6g065450 [Medicago truncatula]
MFHQMKQPPAPLHTISSSTSIPLPSNPQIQYFFIKSCSKIIEASRTNIGWIESWSKRKGFGADSVRKYEDLETKYVSPKSEAWHGRATLHNLMVENAEDVPGETKSNFVAPPKVETKPNIDGASVHVEASKYVDSRGKIEKNCLSGHVVKQIRWDLQLLHKDQA